MAASKKRGLGRGLDALLSSPASAEAQADDELRDLSLSAITPNPDQPRRHFDEEALSELADSIRAQGVVQPIVVRPMGGSFQVVAGERRWRAAKLAGLKRIPALVRKLDESAMMAVALIENIQRQDLNPLEEAVALQRLIDDCGLTHERVAESVGRSRAAVSNLLRLLELPDEIQNLVREDKLTLGHAKAILGAAVEDRVLLAQRVVALGLSVRQTELLARGDKGRSDKKKENPPVSADAARLQQLESEFQKILKSGVKLRPGKAGGGQLVIGYRQIADLDKLLKKLR